MDSGGSDLDDAPSQGGGLISREEAKGYLRAAAAYLGYLQKQTRGNFSAYEKDLQALAAWAGELSPGRANEPPSDDALELLEQLGTPSTCVVGHQLQPKEGQTVFHITGRFCAVCLRDLERRETRYACPCCTKYDVCERCSEVPGARLLGRRAHLLAPATRDTQTKYEGLLRSALRDLRQRIAKLDECKERPKAPRGSWRAKHHRRQSDDAPLEEELTEMLPDPIRQDKLEEALSADACQHMHAVPWRIFNLMTGAIWFIWMVAFVWSLCDAFTTDDLGRPHPAILTAEWNETYNPDTVGWPDRRLAPSGGSSAAQVSVWLGQLGYPLAAQKSLALHVDGRHIRFFDAEAWHELGVPSRLDQARLSSLLESL